MKITKIHSVTRPEDTNDIVVRATIQVGHWFWKKLHEVRIYADDAGWADIITTDGVVIHAHYVWVFDHQEMTHFNSLIS